VQCHDRALSVFDPTNFPAWHAKAKENKEIAVEKLNELKKGK
jgi:hypothetical protein